MTVAHKLETNQEIEFAVRSVETARDLESINSWIELISALDPDEAARALARIYQNSPWRDTKKTVLAAMGPLASARSWQMLIRIAGDSSDLTLAEAAISALVQSPSPVGYQFLIHLIHRPHHPLAATALRAVAAKPWFLNVDRLVNLLQSLPPRDRLTEQLIIALGQFGNSSHAQYIDVYLEAHSLREDRDLHIAALIAGAKIGGKRVLAKIRALPRSDDVSVMELRRMSCDSIELRLRHGTLDAVVMLATQDPLEVSRAMSLLREIPPEKAWQEYQDSGKSLAPASEVWFRAMTHCAEKLQDNLDFLVKQAAHLREESVTLLGARIIYFALREDLSSPSQNSKMGSPIEASVHTLSKSEKVELDHIIATMQRAGLMPILAQISHPRIANVFLTLMEVADEKEQFTIINHLTVQALTFPKDHAVYHAIVQRFMKIMRTTSSPALGDRAVRALAEVGYREDTFLENLKGMLKAKTISLAAALYYLELAAVSSCRPFVLKFLKAELQLIQPDKNSLRTMLRILGQQLNPNDSELTAPLTSAWSKLASHVEVVDLYQLLSQMEIPGSHPWIEDGLKSENILTLLSAIAAARLNQNDAIRENLLALLQHPEPAVRIRAIDALARNQIYPSHKALIQYFEQDHKADSHLMLQAFSAIKVNPVANYSSVLAAVRRLTKRLSLPALSPLRDACESLINHLADQSQEIEVSSVLTSVHDLDAGLALAVADFPNYSTAIKSVLRNAELIHMRKDIFDHLVDKSSGIVQYVKAIDLLLHERLGARLIAGGAEGMLTKMQSMLYVMGLNDQRVQEANYPQILDAEELFQELSFPAAKFRALCLDIASGRLLHHYHRSVDGLRAWALLLLLYGRNFRQDSGVSITGIFPLQTLRSEKIKPLAKALHALQDRRNDAAHRGTLVDLDQIMKCRAETFLVLNSLQEILIPT
jgi:HEAT repeat protein